MAAKAGHADATWQGVRLLKELGRSGEALSWLQDSDCADDPQVMTKKGELLEKNGALEEALGCYQRAALAGDPHAMSKATWLLERTDRADAALTWLEELAAGDVRGVFARGANMLERVGRTAEAITWLLKQVEAGTGHALVEAVSLLDDVGRAADATRLRMYGIEPRIDDHSRFCVIATVVRRATGRAVCRAFVAAMRVYGIPDEVLSDNGKQFTGRFGKPRPAEVLFGLPRGQVHSSPVDEGLKLWTPSDLEPVTAQAPVSAGGPVTAEPVQWPDAIEIDRVVPASGTMSIGPQQFWLGPARTGQQVRFWIDTTTVHLSIDRWRIKTVPSRLSAVDIARLRQAGASPAGPPPAGPAPGALAATSGGEG